MLKGAAPAGATRMALNTTCMGISNRWPQSDKVVAAIPCEGENAEGAL
jgi:hypothetical protein